MICPPMECYMVCNTRTKKFFVNKNTWTKFDEVTGTFSDGFPKTYEKQVSKILDIKNPKLFKREHNSRWFKRPDKRGSGRFDFEFFVGLA